MSFWAKKGEESEGKSGYSLQSINYIPSNKNYRKENMLRTKLRDITCLEIVKATSQNMHYLFKIH